MPACLSAGLFAPWVAIYKHPLWALRQLAHGSAHFRTNMCCAVSHLKSCGGTHAGHVVQAHALLGVAVTQVRAQQVEIPCVDLSDKRLGLRVQVSGPHVRASSDVCHLLGRNLHVRVAMRREDLVRGQREEASVYKDRGAVGLLKELSLRDHQTIVQVGLACLGAVDVSPHQTLRESVEVARGKVCRVHHGAAPTEDGHHPLIGVAEHAEDGLVAEVRLCRILGPILPGRIHETATRNVGLPLPKARVTRGGPGAAIPPLHAVREGERGHRVPEIVGHIRHDQVALPTRRGGLLLVQTQPHRLLQQRDRAHVRGQQALFVRGDHGPKQQGRQQCSDRERAHHVGRARSEGFRGTVGRSPAGG
mmetsp:Transcript_61134/g.189391  ORF Transcript_61134/g.189391 Transcript_61134/m.189391 type:complete len:362 (-) Transcript_61134:24-1109(-)